MSPKPGLPTLQTAGHQIVHLGQSIVYKFKSNQTQHSSQIQYIIHDFFLLDLLHFVVKKKRKKERNNQNDKFYHLCRVY